MGPRHVAVILDGNGRWATSRGLSRVEGHKAGAENLLSFVRSATRRGIETLTVFGFSTENWSRPEGEVEALMTLIGSLIRDRRSEFIELGVRLRIMGEGSVRIPRWLALEIEKTELDTSHCTEMQLIICFDYGSRREILDAVKRLAAESDVVELNDESIRRYLYLPDLPDPDLIIRPGGEIRLSNFLLWQAAYAELYFSEVPWPDFDDVQLGLAIDEFNRRNRTYGDLEISKDQE